MGRIGGRALAALACGALAFTLASCGSSPPVNNSPAVVNLVKDVRSAVADKGSVHIVIHRRQTGKKEVELLSGDIGSTSADEHIVQGGAIVSIRVTPKASYFSGNASGLTTFLGLSKKDAARAGDRWVENKVGSTQYKDLYQADTMSSLPNSLLPNTSSDAVTLASSSSAGAKVKTLTWKSSDDGSTVAQTLVVPATGSPLPLTETTKVSSIDQTSTFTAWGEHLNVVAPPAADVVSYSSVTSG